MEMTTSPRINHLFFVSKGNRDGKLVRLERKNKAVFRKRQDYSRKDLSEKKKFWMNHLDQS